MTPIVIVPGLDGSGETHWQTFLQRSLPNATRVEQDNWERPKFASWMDRLAREVETRPGAILVAHSLGCPLVAHLAVRHPDLTIEAALLVAPADVDSPRHTPGRARGFAPIPVQPLPFRSIVVASTDDPFMELERARALAAAWGAEFVNAGPVGHINVDSGFGPWPDGQRMVQSLMARAAGRSARWSRAAEGTPRAL